MTIAILILAILNFIMLGIGLYLFRISIKRQAMITHNQMQIDKMVSNIQDDQTTWQSTEEEGLH